MSSAIWSSPPSRRSSPTGVGNWFRSRPGAVPSPGQNVTWDRIGRTSQRGDELRWPSHASTGFDSFSPDMGVDLLEQLKICDAGDIFVIPANLEKSFDIDVRDPGFAPGTATPEPGGLLPREALRAVRLTEARTFF